MREYSFPPEFVNPKDKELAEYGLRAAKAMYYSNNRYGSRIFYEYDYFDALTELAQGNQSVEPIRRLFGFRRNPGDALSDGPESLAYIDPKILNLAPKYVNRAVEKMQKTSYDIALDAIDLRSVDEKADWRAVIQSAYRLRDFANTMGVPLQAAFDNFDVSTLPKYPDELISEINTNPRLQRELDGELTLQLVQSINRFKQKLRQVDWDLVTYGMGHLHIFHDSNFIPRIERINPKYWGGAYMDNDDFEDQQYAFFLDCITVNDLIKEAGTEFSQSQLHEIAERYRLKNGLYSNGTFKHAISNYDGLDYILVMRFYFLSEDQQKYVTRKNQYGSKILIEKPFNWEPKENLERYLQNGDSKVLSPSYTSVYGGTWIIDSDIVYNYGRKPYPRTNLVNSSLPIVSFGTNFKNGRPVSFLSQMIEPLNMINAMWNKVKGDLAKGWTGIREIDFSTFENVAMGKGGNVWSPREVYEFLEMTNTAVVRRDEGVGGQKYDAVKFQNSGITIADYFTAINTALMFLEQMTGTSVGESSNIPDRLAVQVMQQSQMTGDLDMGYLYNAHENIYQRASHQLLLLSQETKRKGKTIRGFNEAIRQAFDVPKDIAYTEYGMRMSRQPGPQEWVDFYQDVRDALAAGKIGLSDSLYLREIDNLKQARMVMIAREAEYRRQQAEDRQAEMQNQAMINQQSQAQAAQIAQEQMTFEAQKKQELIILEGKIKQMLQNEKAELDAMAAANSDQLKIHLQKQKGIDEIMKQGLKNIPEKMKADKRPDRSPED